MTFTKKKFDYETKTWGIVPINSLITDFQGLELKLFLEDIKGFEKGSEIKLLDLGCGSGNICAFLKKRFSGWDVSGIDISFKAIQLAKILYPGIHFLRGDSEKIPIKSNTLDIITGFDSWEHFSDLKKALSEARRVLKTDGILYISIPLEKQFPSLYWIFFKFGWRGKGTFSGHVNYFNNKEFIKLVEEGGFCLIKTHYSNHLFFSIFDIGYYLLQAVFKGKMGTFETSINKTKSRGAGLALLVFKKIVSAISFFESSLFSGFPGGRGHFLFVKCNKPQDFFSSHPPVTVLNKLQRIYGLKKVIRPKDLAIVRLLNKLNLGGAESILDFGCADGLWLERLLRNRKKVRGYGVDVSPLLIQKADSTDGKKGNYYLSDKTWPLKDGIVDFCVSFDVFEHIKDKNKEIRRIYNTLKPGGRFLFFTMNPKHKYTYDWLFEILGSDFLYRRADHDKNIFISPPDFKRQTYTVGFRNIKTELFEGPINLFLDVLCYGYLALTERIIEKIRFKKFGSVILWINDKIIRMLYPLSSFMDNIVFKTGNSNGYFIYGMKPEKSTK